MIIGLDIGGANLKASDGLKQSTSVPFPLWQKPEQLSRAISDLLASYPASSPVAITMTGELADCFPTRAVGVQEILHAAVKATSGREVMVWQTAGEFVTPEEAAEFPSLVAASNWHALATWAGRMAPVGTSLLIDVGSTTTDIIPMEDGVPACSGWNDLDRLASGELLYLGCRRTPLCSLTGEVPFRGRSTGIAREFFATTQDIHLLLGHLPEDPNDHGTANGRPATKQEAANRLSRMLCSDSDDLSGEEIDGLAAEFFRIELELLQRALEKVLLRHSAPHSLLLTGEGEFLGTRLIEFCNFPEKPVEILSLSRSLGEEHSQAACAFALARLASERRSPEPPISDLS